jgi:hypothetical protein
VKYSLLLDTVSKSDITVTDKGAVKSVQRFLAEAGVADA